MTDKTSQTEDAPKFETDTVQADRAREQGLGFGERELKAQREPGDGRIGEDDAHMEDGSSVNADDGDAPDQSIGVQGKDEA